MENRVIEEAIEYIRTLFQGNSDGHDFDHTMRVYHTAMEITDSEPRCNRQIVALAALLHDADDYKLFETKNNANARAFLDSQNIDEATALQICMAINSVSFSKNKGRCPELLEGKIVQDADRLDAMGAVGIARTFAYGGRHGRSIEDSVEHFHEKLLLIKDMMNTSEATKLANERHAFLEAFIEEMNKEIQIK